MTPTIATAPTVATAPTAEEIIKEREEKCCNKCKIYICISLLILLLLYLICLIVMIIVLKYEGEI